MNSFLVLLFASVALAGVPRRDVRIVGGSDTEVQIHPYMVSIHYNGNFVCGGTIINKQYVLTAASCVDKRSAALIQVRAGSTEYDEGGHTHEILTIKKHNSYDAEKHEYDFALIKVSPAFKIGTLGVNLINLEEEDQGEAGELSAKVIGWGYTCAECPPAEILQEVELKLYPRDVCKVRYTGIVDITERMICAREMGKDRCEKDQGGPLVDVRTGRQIGIASFGKGCADPMYPGVYASIAADIAWIRTNSME